MPHLPLAEHLPGITGLLEYRQETGKPLRELTQILLRGPSSLSEGERELIATLVSSRNECKYCTDSHAAAADLLLGERLTSLKIKEDISTAPISDKMKSLLTIAGQVQESGKNVSNESIQKAKLAGASDLEIHDTVLIAALFCLYNRYVDGLATFAPTDPNFYNDVAERIVKNGYNRLPGGYDHLKK